MCHALGLRFCPFFCDGSANMFGAPRASSKPPLHCRYRLSVSGCTEYMLGVEDDGSHSLQSFQHLKLSFLTLSKLCSSFGARIVRSPEADAERARALAPEGVDEREVERLLSEGANIVWFAQDFPDAPPCQEHRTCCRIGVSIAQVSISNVGFESSRASVVSVEDDQSRRSPCPSAESASAESDPAAEPASPSDSPSPSPVPSVPSVPSAATSGTSVDSLGKTSSNAMRILVLGNVDAGKVSMICDDEKQQRPPACAAFSGRRAKTCRVFPLRSHPPVFLLPIAAA